MHKRFYIEGFENVYRAYVFLTLSISEKNSVPLSPVQVLWGEERAENGTTTKQSFVDLGCGNGLLVHILNNEGVG